MAAQTSQAPPAAFAAPGSEVRDDSNRPPSLNQLLRRHCRERLVVTPLHWTERHLHLLGFSFDEPRPAGTDVEIQVKDPSYRPFSRFVLDRWGDRGLVSSITSLLEDPNYPLRWLQPTFRRPGRWVQDPPPFTGPSDGILFHFNSRTTTRLACRLFGYWEGLQDSPKPPMLVLVGYLDLQYLVESRARSLTSYQGNDRRGCSKTFSLFRRKLAQVTPKDPWRDPYIVALLIAIAQKQRRNLRRPQPEDGAFVFSPKLVLSSRKDRQRLFVYTSEIPSSFLDLLDNPTMTPASPFDMAVGVTEVLYEPYASLRERLFQILLPRRKNLHLIDDDADPSNHRPSTP